MESSDEHRVDRRTRYDAELPFGGDRSCQTPIRHGHAHAALDDQGVVGHERIVGGRRSVWGRRFRHAETVPVAADKEAKPPLRDSRTLSTQELTIAAVILGSFEKIISLSIKPTTAVCRKESSTLISSKRGE